MVWKTSSRASASVATNASRPSSSGQITCQEPPSGTLVEESRFRFLTPFRRDTLDQEAMVEGGRTAQVGIIGEHDQANQVVGPTLDKAGERGLGRLEPADPARGLVDGEVGRVHARALIECDDDGQPLPRDPSPRRPSGAAPAPRPGHPAPAHARLRARNAATTAPRAAADPGTG